MSHRSLRLSLQTFVLAAALPLAAQLPANAHTSSGIQLTSPQLTLRIDALRLDVMTRASYAGGQPYAVLEFPHATSGNHPLDNALYSLRCVISTGGARLRRSGETCVCRSDAPKARAYPGRSSTAAL
ncbi:hypothetical protein GOB94_12775 [Granulicella sp. 5B5]|uniref:hypothetical protein n=1 Tax=Granulicella sp. 5B5 TaxID=1617967 RepID=UPI0015F4AD5E|nr:hypothetical protein [Granulicella sp. 5B5]QMV19461.1 hypothetical protein GOB94_12775 [Granulicella sp. 5B5]